MRVAIIADVFPPSKTSAAVQVRDLAYEFAAQGHTVSVLVPDADLDKPWLLDEINGVQVLRLRSLKTKDIGYVRRTVAEFLMPFVMLRNYRKGPLANTRWDGVVWYSPTIFLGPMANALKRSSGCKSYLVLRDIFPEWAVDMGLLGRGLPYRFFKAIEQFQYSVADVIGVQTPANLPYFDSWSNKHRGRIEVLQNWLAEAPNVGCSNSVEDSPLAGRMIFVYAGNMGVAQGVGIFLELADRLRNRQDIGFLFVGRGSDVKLLREIKKERCLDNVVFHDEIDPSEISGLYAQCHVGMVALDPRHRTHNIPGKFLSYLQAGLPVLASINSGNDLEEIINRERVGRVCTEHSLDTLQRLVEELVDEIAEGNNMSLRCKALSTKLFSPKIAVTQIAAAF